MEGHSNFLSGSSLEHKAYVRKKTIHYGTPGVFYSHILQFCSAGCLAKGIRDECPTFVRLRGYFFIFR